MEHVQSKEPRSAAEHRQRWSTSIAGRSRRSAKTERSEGTINRAEATIQSTPAPTSEPVFHTVALTAPGALATATSTSPADACSRSTRRVKEPHGRHCCTVGCCSSCTHRRALPDQNKTQLCRGGKPSPPPCHPPGSGGRTCQDCRGTWTAGRPSRSPAPVQLMDHTACSEGKRHWRLLDRAAHSDCISLGHRPAAPARDSAYLSSCGHQHHSSSSASRALCRLAPACLPRPLLVAARQHVVHRNVARLLADLEQLALHSACGREGQAEQASWIRTGRMCQCQQGNG